MDGQLLDKPDSAPANESIPATEHKHALYHHAVTEDSRSSNPFHSLPLPFREDSFLNNSNVTPQSHADQPQKKTSESRYSRIMSSITSGNLVDRVDILSYYVTEDFVMYEVSVSNGKLKWNLWQRFAQFQSLNAMLEDLIANMSHKFPVQLPPFPDRKLHILQDHYDHDFIGQRLHILAHFLKVLIQHPDLRYSNPVVSFLTPDPDEQEVTYVKPHPSNFASTNLNSNLSSIINVNVDPINITQDDEITAVEIVSANVVKPTIAQRRTDHTIFHISVSNCNKRKSFAEWTTLKRFADFHNFDNALRTEVGLMNPLDLSKIPPLTGRIPKLFVDHLNETFIERRRLELDWYVKRLLKFPEIRRHPLTLQFLGVQVENYI